jgi:hypothetical protein
MVGTSAAHDELPASLFDEFVIFPPERHELETRQTDNIATEPSLAPYEVGAMSHQEAEESVSLPMTTTLPDQSSENVSACSTIRDVHTQHRPMRSISGQEWEAYRDIIKELYNRMPLKEVMAYMSEQHEFIATARMYKTRLNHWGLGKYMKSRDMKSLVHKIRSSRESDNAVELQIDGKAGPIAKVERYARRRAPGFGQGDSSPLSCANSDEAFSSPHGSGSPDIVHVEPGVHAESPYPAALEVFTFESPEIDVYPPKKPQPQNRNLHSHMQPDTFQQALFLAMMLTAMVKQVPLGNISEVI